VIFVLRPFFLTIGAPQRVFVPNAREVLMIITISSIEQ
jgi:hypothetical protein